MLNITKSKNNLFRVIYPIIFILNLRSIKKAFNRKLLIFFAN